MRCISVVLVAAFAAIANAHFQLQYPLPRGPFVENLEPNFCDGYTNVTQNRTVFPISNGVISLKSEHPKWTAGIIISTIQDPTSFADFNSSSMVVPFFQTNGAGAFCFPINITASGVSGVQDGANVTIQVVYDGGDGKLYQCADLTLSANATVLSNATSTCTNVTASATAASPTVTASSAAVKNIATLSSAIATLLVGIASFL